MYRNSIGVPLFQGTLNEQVSKIRRKTEKPHKIIIKIALIQIVNKKIVKYFCEITFPRSDDLNEFEKEFNKSLETLKSQSKKDND